MAPPSSALELTDQDKSFLLELAREAISASIAHFDAPQVDDNSVSWQLRQPAAVFVTLYLHNELRGCTGTLVAQKPLFIEVARIAAQTASSDPRFAPVTARELDDMTIEISVLSTPRKLVLDNPLDLPESIRPGIDGLTLYKGMYRATFLPQVWTKIPDPHQFVEMLTQKMGLPRNNWQQPGMEAEVYQVIEFSESDNADARRW